MQTITFYCRTCSFRCNACHHQLTLSSRLPHALPQHSARFLPHSSRGISSPPCSAALWSLKALSLRPCFSPPCPAALVTRRWSLKPLSLRPCFSSSFSSFPSSRSSSPSSPSANFPPLPLFSDLPLSDSLKKALTQVYHYSRPSEGQARVLSSLGPHQDLLLKSPTGTGKTLAVLLPALETLLASHHATGVGVLVISPTRELATQIATEASKLATFLPAFRILHVMGGESMKKEANMLREGAREGRADVVVGTVGRLLHHCQETEGFRAMLSHLKVLILDEADRLLDMGFRQEILQIVGYLPPPRPSARQKQADGEMDRQTDNQTPKPPAVPTVSQTSRLYIEDYSEKSFVVRGTTDGSGGADLLRHVFMTQGGKWSKKLKGGSAWVFPKSKRATIFEALAEISRKEQESSVTALAEISRKEQESSMTVEPEMLDKASPSPLSPLLSPPSPPSPLLSPPSSAISQPTPSQVKTAGNYRQTFLLSATLSDEILPLAEQIMSAERLFIDIGEVSTQAVAAGDEEGISWDPHVQQYYLVCSTDKQLKCLAQLLGQHQIEQHLAGGYKVIVFCPTARHAEFLCQVWSQMSEWKTNTMVLTSRQPQRVRTEMSLKFREGTNLLLFTSDLSARGLDYPDVSLVVQLGVTERRQYVHRIGRTARAGKTGQGILLVAPQESDYVLGALKGLPLTPLDPAIEGEQAKDQELRTILQSISDHQDLAKVAGLAYKSWLGCYSMRLQALGWDKATLVKHANEFALSLGLSSPPLLDPAIVNHLRLNRIPGLRIQRDSNKDVNFAEEGADDSLATESEETMESDKDRADEYESSSEESDWSESESESSESSSDEEEEEDGEEGAVVKTRRIWKGSKTKKMWKLQPRQPKRTREDRGKKDKSKKRLAAAQESPETEPRAPTPKHKRRFRVRSSTHKNSYEWQRLLPAAIPPRNLKPFFNPKALNPKSLRVPGTLLETSRSSKTQAIQHYGVGFVMHCDWPIDKTKIVLSLNYNLVCKLLEEAIERLVETDYRLPLMSQCDLSALLEQRNAQTFSVNKDGVGINGR
eukprot:g61014.t1